MPQLLIILIILIINFLIVMTRLWLIDNVFHLKQKKSTLTLLTLIIGLISGAGMLFYPKLLTLLNLSQFSFINLSSGGSQLSALSSQLLYFLGYLAILGIVIFLVINRTNRKKVGLQTILFLGLFFVIGSLLNNFSALSFQLSALMYYVFIAFGEEFLKYITGRNFFEQYQLAESDIILFSILAALGFSFIENFVYISGTLTTQDGLLTTAIQGGSVALSRGLTSFLLHLVFTGTIGYFALRGQQLAVNTTSMRKKFSALSSQLLIGIILGVGLHFLYDIVLYNHITLLIILFIVGAYFLLTYLLYKADRLYALEN